MRLFSNTLPNGFRPASAVMFGLTLCGALLFLLSCDTYCKKGEEPLWEATTDEYRLEMTNSSAHMVELIVNGESQGAFCAGITRAPVGNFKRGACTKIRAVFLDNPSRIDLDDCLVDGLLPCKENNPEGEVCYDTRDSLRVEARLD